MLFWVDKFHVLTDLLSCEALLNLLGMEDIRQLIETIVHWCSTTLLLHTFSLYFKY